MKRRRWRDTVDGQGSGGVWGSVEARLEGICEDAEPIRERMIGEDGWEREWGVI